MIAFFKKEGSHNTEQLLREQIPLLLYNNGEGRIVTRMDYLKWKYRNQSHVCLFFYFSPYNLVGPAESIISFVLRLFRSSYD